MGRQCQKQTGWTRVARVIGVALLLGAVILSAGRAAADDPDMSNVDDILGGQRSLIPADDLVAWWPTRPGSCVSNCDPRNYRISPLLLDNGGATVTGSHSTYPDHPVCAETVNGPLFPGPMQTRVARLFNTSGGAFIVTVVANDNASGRDCSGTNNVTFHVDQPVTGASASTTITTSAQSLQLGVADFDFDGLDDLIVMNSDEMFVASAADPTGKSMALAFGPSLALSFEQTPQNQPAVGDLNDDGILDIAWIGGRQSNTAVRNVYLASICPGDVAGTICGGAQRFQIIPASGTEMLTSLYGNSGFDGLDQDNPAVNVLVGNFDVDRGGDELVLLDQDLLGNNCYLRSYEVNAGLTKFTQTSEVQVCNNSKTVTVPTNQLDGIVATSGPLVLYENGVVLNEEQAAHQVVIAQTKQTNYNESKTMLTLVSYGSGLKPTVFHGPTFSTQQLQIVIGVAIGRFSGTSNFGSSAATTNQQIAVLRGSPSPTVLFYDVASLADLTPAYTTAVTDTDLNFVESKNLQGNLLSVGDLQGRSLRLGAPEVVRVEAHSQPLVVIGVPPMHADYVQPIGASAPEVFNFTVVPDSYNSTYTVDSDNKENSASTSTTSYTYSKKVTTGGGVGFKAEGASIGASEQSTIGKVQENTVSSNYDTYVTRMFDASSTTTLGDIVAFHYSRLNIYNYPILGVTAADGSPEYVTFSAPDQISESTTSGIPSVAFLDGSTLEWYQPVHEPGNIFSYPWSSAQLATQYPNLIALSSGISFSTGTTTDDTGVKWTTGGGNNQSTGSTNTQSHTTSESVSGGIKGTGGSAGVDYGSSTAFSTLYSDSTSLGASTGVLIMKPDTFIEPTGDYQYLVEPYIFSQMLPSNTQGNVPIPTPTPNISTTGPIRTAYVVDPRAASGGGDWWSSGSSPYLQNPDVAVNHPQRWYSERAADTGDQCRPAAGNTYDCVTFNSADFGGGDVWITPFYTMRGFFITTTDANGEGPQLTEVNAGTDLFLQARVYNYSFAAMPSGTTAKINFYRQPWDKSISEPIGDSVLINSVPVTIGQIPAFEGTTNEPNYLLPHTVLSTNDLGDTYQTFWVVVWMEKQDGTLAPEIPGHGLTGIPTNLKYITNAPIEPYSNNVGFYHGILHINGSQGAATAAPARAAVLGRELRVDDVAAVPGVVQLYQPVVVKAQISAVGGDVSSVQVLFAATDLAGHRTFFDEERPPYIAADNSYQVRVLYRPSFCGTQRIEVLARDTTHFLPAAGHSDLEVECPAEATPTPSVTARLTETATNTAAPTQASGSPGGEGCQLSSEGAGLGSWLLLLGTCALIWLRSGIVRRGSAAGRTTRLP